MVRETGKMATQGLNNILRAVRKGDDMLADQIIDICSTAISRLGTSGAGTASTGSIPTGSDQLDVGSFARWAELVPRSDAEAVKQIHDILATAKLRKVG